MYVSNLKVINLQRLRLPESHQEREPTFTVSFLEKFQKTRK